MKTEDRKYEKYIRPGTDLTEVRAEILTLHRRGRSIYKIINMIGGYFTGPKKEKGVMNNGNKKDFKRTIAKKFKDSKHGYFA